MRTLRNQLNKLTKPNVPVYTHIGRGVKRCIKKMDILYSHLSYKDNDIVPSTAMSTQTLQQPLLMSWWLSTASRVKLSVSK